MTLSDLEIRALRAANPALGWAEIPHGCPANFVQHICETRARRIGEEFRADLGGPVIETAAEVQAVRDRLAAVSL